MVDRANPGKAALRRQGGRVWLEGVQGWFCGQKQSSVHAAHEAVMRAMGEEVSYDDLLGVSGLAFRMQVHRQGLCPSSPHAFCGYHCVERSLQALPWEARAFEVKPEDTEGVREARAAVVESIERGAPAQYGREEDGVIIGYAKGGEEWLCLHPLRDRGEKPFVETEWPWGILVFTQRKTQRLAERDLAMAALAQAVEMARLRECAGYMLGFAAWEHYARVVLGLGQTGDEARRKAMAGNAWIYECLVQYRACAARWLTGIAGLFDDAQAGHINAAAAIYDEMASRVLTGPGRGSMSIAPYAWSLKPGQEWTDEMRVEQVRRLEQGLGLERRAVAEIEKVVQ
ncbi:MAG TPA: hypothetical protein P5137_05300 [Candidatus Brocadiia bacterium]|nr:hypothetical protein [Candidatus Brocadiia bacterium]